MPAEFDKCLEFDPFEGDFGEPGDHTFYDRLVVARKEHECSHCGNVIRVGEQHRSRGDKSDGELMKFRWCPACCMVMAECEVDAQTDEEWDRREAFEAQWETRGSEREHNRALRSQRAAEGGAT